MHDKIGMYRRGSRYEMLTWRILMQLFIACGTLPPGHGSVILAEQQSHITQQQTLWHQLMLCTQPLAISKGSASSYKSSRHNGQQVKHISSTRTCGHDMIKDLMQTTPEEQQRKIICMHCSVLLTGCKEMMPRAVNKMLPHNTTHMQSAERWLNCKASPARLTVSTTQSGQSNQTLLLPGGRWPELS